MAREIVVGTTVNGNQILSISGEGKQRKYEVKRPCGHSTLLGSWQLLYGKPAKEGFNGCAVCSGKSRTPEGSMVGRVAGTFTITGLSTQRRNNRPLWNGTCTVCGAEELIGNETLCAAKQKRCKNCKKLSGEKVRANPSNFTPEETEELHIKIRKGVHSVARKLCNVSHTALNSTEDDVLQSAWANFLTVDLRTKSWDSIRAVACGCGKNAAHRVFNQCSMKFVEPYIDAEGDEVRGVDCLPTPEPDYEYESAETDMHRDELHTELNALQPEERSLLLSDVNNLAADQKTKYTLLVERLKNTLAIPSIQIQPL